MGASVKQKIDGALYPDEVAIAASAFQAALAFVSTQPWANAYLVRWRLAEYICEHALLGELDVEKLRDGALRYLENGFSPRTLGIDDSRKAERPAA